MSRNSLFSISGILLLALLLLGLSACKKKKAEKIKKSDEKTITDYIAWHKLNAVATGSGLYYVIDAPGVGNNPTINSTVTVNYKGYFPDGTVFDQSSGAGATFSLTGVIKGWQEGIPLFKKNGKGKLLVPSALGYGTTGQGSIPPNAVLIFDIEVLNIQ